MTVTKCAGSDSLSTSHIYFQLLGLKRGNLHSFPTRRSSDLITSNPSIFGIWMSRNTRSGSCARIACTARSEEHTSELQSRLQLVCRLLLEKKKENLPSNHQQS